MSIAIQEGSMPGDGVAQPHDQPKDETLTAYCTPGQKNLAHALAEEVYNSSIGGLIRHLLEEAGHDQFDDEVVQTILSGDVTEDEAIALVKDEVSVEDINELPASAVADGGNATQPSNYSAQLTTAELKQTGRELSWDELRTIVADPEDGGRWSETLEIHPDRVPETAFKRRQKPVARVLTAMARAESYNGLLPADDLTDLIDTYCLHLTDRLNEERGKDYIRRTYRQNVEEYLWEHPNPSVNTYYTNEDRYLTAVDATIQEDINPALVEDTPAIFNQSAWEQAADRDVATVEWRDDLGDYIEFAATASAIGNEIDKDELAEMDFEQQEEANDAAHHFVQLWTAFLEDYREKVPKQERERVESHHVTDAALERLGL